jgi:adenosylcobinamide-GDP ribazoletransferase
VRWTGPTRKPFVRDGLRLALTTFTVLPLPPGRVDRATARLAMVLAPAVGALLGLVLAVVALGLSALGAPGLVLGGAAVGLGAALTRGLHLDGLADTVDGLGSYTARPRALAIMRSPEVGPFGVVAIVLAVLIQAGAIAGIATRPALAVLAGLVTGLATGRLAVTWACRRGMAAARPDGLGALVAGTTQTLELALGLVAVALVAVPAVPDRPWQGPLAVLVGLGASVVVHRHAVSRLGGITGDVLGALVEIAQTVTLVGLSFG